MNNTFLKGDLKERVFMAQPKGFVDHTKPNYYGLKQAPRAWFEKLKGALVNSNKRVEQVVSNLNKTFALKELGSLNYFLGFEAYRDSSDLYLTQIKYILDLLVKTNMQSTKGCLTPMVTSRKLRAKDGELFDQPSLFRNTIGAL